MSFTAQDDESISDGTTIETVAALCDASKQILAFGINCSSPAVISNLLKKIRTVSQKPLVTYPNSGEVYDGATDLEISSRSHSHFTRKQSDLASIRCKSCWGLLPNNT